MAECSTVTLRGQRKETPLYHFTAPHRTGHLGAILRDGQMNVTESNVSLCKPHAGPDVVWLADTPYADQDHGLTHEIDGRRVTKTWSRVTVEVPDAMRWSAFCIRHNVKRTTMEALASRGGANAWCVVLRPIERSEWAAVHVLKDGEWQPVHSERDLYPDAHSLIVEALGE